MSNLTFSSVFLVFLVEKQKNSRFQGSVSRFTEKTVSSQPKMQEKQKKTSGCSLLSFPGAYKIFFGLKMARKEQFFYHRTSFHPSTIFFHSHQIKENSYHPTECQIKTEVDGRTTAIKLLGGKVRFTSQNGQSDNSEAKFKEVPISSETNYDIHALSNHAKICSP